LEVGSNIYGESSAEQGSTKIAERAEGYAEERLQIKDNFKINDSNN
jgi:hypothetical protein